MNNREIILKELAKEGKIKTDETISYDLTKEIDNIEYYVNKINLIQENSLIIQNHARGLRNALKNAEPLGNNKQITDEIFNNYYKQQQSNQEFRNLLALEADMQGGYRYLMHFREKVLNQKINYSILSKNKGYQTMGTEDYSSLLSIFGMGNRYIYNSQGIQKSSVKAILDEAFLNYYGENHQGTVSSGKIRDNRLEEINKILRDNHIPPYKKGRSTKVTGRIWEIYYALQGEEINVDNVANYISNNMLNLHGSFENIAFYREGDVGNTQLKYTGTRMGASVNLNSIKNGLVELKKVLENFINNKDKNQLEQELLNLFTREGDSSVSGLLDAEKEEATKAIKEFISQVIT